MRRSSRFAAVALLNALLGALVLAPTLLAKEGGVARFDAPLPKDPAPGSTLALGWTVTVHEDGGGATVHEDGGGTSPVTGAPIFVRLLSMDGSSVEVPGAERPAGSGHYVASVTVPAAGLARVEVGLVGESCPATGSGCQRSDWMFVLSNELSGFAAGPAGNAIAPGASDAPRAAPAEPVATGAPVAAPAQPVAAPMQPVAAGTPAWPFVGASIAVVVLLAVVAAVVAARLSSRRRRSAPAER